jgi:hypothetical protein
MYRYITIVACAFAWGMTMAALDLPPEACTTDTECECRHGVEQ